MFVAAQHRGRVNCHEVIGSDGFIHVMILPYSWYVLAFLRCDQLKQIVTPGLPLLLLQEQVVGACDLVVLIILYKLLVLLGRALDDVASFRVGGRRQTTIEREVVQLAQDVGKHRNGIFSDDDALQLRRLSLLRVGKGRVCI